MVATGTDSLQNGAVGESARGYTLMDQHPGAWPAGREYAYVHSDTLRANDQEFQGTVTDVASVLQEKLGSVASFRRSRDQHPHSRAASRSGPSRRCRGCSSGCCGRSSRPARARDPV